VPAAASRAPARASSLTCSELVVMRTSTDKCKDSQVGTPKTMEGIPDRWHTCRVVGV